MPESRLKSEVLPAPFGPMIPSSSPSATSRLTSATMEAPPMSSPRLCVARMVGGFMTVALRSLLLERRDRGLDVAGRDRLQDLDAEVAAARRQELHLEHRLQHCVVGAANVLLALRREELPALEGADLLRRVGAALLERAADHLCRDE